MAPSSNRSKRARHSAPADDDVDMAAAAAVGTDDDEGEDGESAEEPAPGMSDDSEDSEPDEDEAEKRLERRTRETGSAPSSAGIIDEICCVHFMCHKKLRIKFNRRINFINGENGSGKSAILAALQICLGSSAKHTHRGNKLGDLVREGHSGEAIVSVTLVNEGADACKPELYGKSITIERKFAREGASKLRLLSDNGDCVARDKKELRLVLDWLKVAVDNPVCVLDQENAKNFIRGKARDKYAFFLKATEIDTVLNRIMAVQKSAVKCIGDAARQRRKLKDIAEVYQKAQLEHEEIVRLQKFDVDLRDLKVVGAWVQVRQAEGTLISEQKLAADAERALEQAQGLAEQACRDADALTKRQQGSDGAVRHSEAEITRLKLEIDGCAASTREARGNVADHAKVVRAATSALRIDQSKHRDVDNDFAHARRDLEIARKDNAKKMAAANSGAKGKKMAKIQIKLQDLEAQQARLKEDVGNGEERSAKLKVVLSEKTDSLKGLDLEAREVRHEATVAQQHLKQLEAQTASPLNAFGDYQTELRRAVTQRSREFQRPPVGPIGAHVKLAENGAVRWTKALEVCIGNRLGSWVVTSKQDKATLLGFARQLRCERSLNVIVQPLRPRHNVRDLAREHGFVTVNSVIQVDDDLAYNVLVDMHKIDGVCLFADKADAEQRGVAQNQGRAANVSGVMQMLLENGDETGARDGTYFLKRNANAGRSRALFGVDVSAALPAARQQSEDAQRNAADGARLVAEARKEHDVASRALQQVDTQWHNATDALGRVEAQLRSQKAQLADAENDAEADLHIEDTSQLEQEIQRIEAALQELQAAVRAANAGVSAAHEAGKPLQDFVRQHEQRNAQLDQEMTRAEDALQREIERETASKSEAARLSKAAEKHAAYAARCAASVEGEQARFDELESKAAKYTRQIWKDAWDGERPAEASKFKSIENLKAKIKTMESMYDRELERRSISERDPDVARMKMEKAKIAYLEKETGCKSVEKEGADLRSDAAARWGRLKAIRRYICRTASREFDRILNHKGSSGQLLFQHPGEGSAGELSLTFQKDNQDTASQIHDINLLSGGERSFSTLAMLIAIGETIECPFRVMDEFDVFMDQARRDL